MDRLGNSRAELAGTVEIDSPVERLARDSWTWVKDNVALPAINAGIIEPHNAVTGAVNGLTGLVAGRELLSRWQPYELPEAEFLSKEWLAQSVFGGLGAMVPYVAAGKLVGGSFRGAGRLLKIEGSLARFLASESSAQILGAGLFDALRDKRAGETRLGNAIGGMAGFAIFEKGNHLSRGVGSMEMRIGAHVGTGLTGGSVQYLTSHLISTGELGSTEDLLNHAVSGGVMNVALPVAQDRLDRAIDGVNSTLGRGIPLERFVQRENLGGHSRTFDELISRNPLTRVQRGIESEANVDHQRNFVSLTKNSSGLTELASELGHELDHRVNGPHSAGSEAMETAARLVRTGDAEGAWQVYKEARLAQEVSARNTERRIAAEMKDERLAGSIITEPAAIPGLEPVVGSTYEQLWRQEFDKFKASDGVYRPKIDYGGRRRNAPDRLAGEKSLLGSADNLLHYSTVIRDSGIHKWSRDNLAANAEHVYSELDDVLGMGLKNALEATYELDARAVHDKRLMLSLLQEGSASRELYEAYLIRRKPLEADLKRVTDEVNARVAEVQKVADTIADRHGFARVKIEAGELKDEDGEEGSATFGQYKNGRVFINIDAIYGSMPVHGTAETLLHELVHAEQAHLVIWRLADRSGVGTQATPEQIESLRATFDELRRIPGTPEELVESVPKEYVERILQMRRGRKLDAGQTARTDKLLDSFARLIRFSTSTPKHEHYQLYREAFHEKEAYAVQDEFGALPLDKSVNLRQSRRELGLAESRLRSLSDDSEESAWEMISRLNSGQLTAQDLFGRSNVPAPVTELVKTYRRIEKGLFGKKSWNEDRAKETLESYLSKRVDDLEARVWKLEDE